MRRKIILLFVILALFLAGCGGGDKRTPTPSPSPTIICPYNIMIQDGVQKCTSHPYPKLERTPTK